MTLLLTRKTKFVFVPAYRDLKPNKTSKFMNPNCDPTQKLFPDTKNNLRIKCCEAAAAHHFYAFFYWPLLKVLVLVVCLKAKSSPRAITAKGFYLTEILKLFSRVEALFFFADEIIQLCEHIKHQKLTHGS